MNFGIKIKIKPNERQEHLLRQHFGANRWLWNYFLAKRMQDYRENKKSSTYIKDAKHLTELKQKKDWLYVSSTASQQRTLKHLDDAYKRFFKGHACFPKFKSKKHDQSFTVAGTITVKENRLCFPKFSEGIKFNRELPEYDKINNVTIKKTASGKYYAVLSVEGKKPNLSKTGKAVGIDMGLIDFAVFSNGKTVKIPKFFKKQQASLKRAQQHLTRKKKGSKRREKQRIKVAQIHEKIANSRRHFLHDLSSWTVKNFDTIAIETLNVKGMVKNHKLSKAIHDASWSEFFRHLKYKSEWYGKNLVTVDRFFPSSKTCNHCGYVHETLPLNVREWNCLGCGEKLDRDLNASLNILAEATSARISPITGMEAV